MLISRFHLCLRAINLKLLLFEHLYHSWNESSLTLCLNCGRIVEWAILQVSSGIHVGTRFSFQLSLSLWFSLSGSTQRIHGEKIITFINKKIWVHFQCFICFPFNLVEPAFVWLFDNSITSLIPISCLKSLKCDMQFQRTKRERKRCIFFYKRILGTVPTHSFLSSNSFTHFISQLPTQGWWMENIEAF